LLRYSCGVEESHAIESPGPSSSLSKPTLAVSVRLMTRPAADKLEDHVLPSVDRIVETVSKAL